MIEITNLPVNIAGNAQIVEMPSTAGAPAHGSVGTPIPATGEPTNYLIQADQDFLVRFEWTQGGGIFIFPVGNWQFDVYFELMGPGEVTSGPFTAVQAGAALPGPLTQDVTVNAGDLDPGIYRVTAAMQFYAGGSPRSLASFEDLGIVHVYQEV